MEQVAENILNMYNFDAGERKEFNNRYQAEKFKYKTALILAVFGGFVGAHHFYLKRWWLGIASILFISTLIPMIAGFIEAFFLKSEIREKNEEIAVAIANSINLRRKLNRFNQEEMQPAVRYNSPQAPGFQAQVSKVTCAYCGSKVFSSETECPNCGGEID
ncbi:MAG: TM2 domain-containing protein [Deltaproteobacteria bacterium]|jgi:TM2 domain-containing membrane protein YozV|nr:TM2 domain-containing protein [Deltaproteobacteria bacterium]